MVKTEEKKAETPVEAPKVAMPGIPNKCPRCNHNLADLSSGPTEDEKQEYIRTLLGDRPYTKKYSLYNGRLNLLFSAISSNASEGLGQILKEIKEDDPQTRMTECLKVKLLYYLRERGDDKYSPPTGAESYEELQTMFQKRFGSMSEDVVAVLIRSYLQFTLLLGQLTEAAFDANFWKGAGLA
jgi:hypothetical protein